MERPLCRDCIMMKANATAPEVDDCISRIRRVVLITLQPRTRCRACGTVGETYSVSGRG
jgi:hypothetical protein